MSDVVEQLRELVIRGSTLNHAAANRIDKLEAKLKAIRDVVDEQADEEGIWFDAMTAPEAYVQRELRRLHWVVKEESE